MIDDHADCRFKSIVFESDYIKSRSKRIAHFQENIMDRATNPSELPIDGHEGPKGINTSDNMYL